MSPVNIETLKSEMSGNFASNLRTGLLLLSILCIMILAKETDKMDKFEYAEFHNNRQSQFVEVHDENLHEFKFDNNYTLISYYEEYCDY